MGGEERELMNEEVKQLIDEMLKKGFSINLLKKDIKKLEISPNKVAYLNSYTIEFVPPDTENRAYQSNA